MVKGFLAPDYTYLRCGMQYVSWFAYDMIACRRSFEHQGKPIQGNDVS
jgi:hypothetical protein